LDQIEENRRGIVYGPAGTGKTLLAIEQAKKSVAAGKKVALLCFNNSIGEWFKTYFSEQAVEFKPEFVGTFHGLMTKILSDAGEMIVVPSDDEAKTVFYEDVMPSKVLELLLNKQMDYDEIIIDEAQDLIRDNYIDVMDLMLKKGFEHGSWKFFGDFSRQAIYTDGVCGQDLLDNLEDRTSFIRYKLTENCRNTKQICDDIQTITGYEAPKDLWTKVEGVPVDHKTCTTEDEELEKLEMLLAELEEKNIENDKITILSPRSRENSVVSKVEGIKIKNYSFTATNDITFSTIQSFKGLENSVIIMVDVSSYSAMNLMYVGLSRARAALYIFETKGAHNEYSELLKRRLLNG
jgi:DNA helicase IV